MNALQSLYTSGVHARRCASVPWKEGEGETVVESKATDTHHRAKGIGRSLQSFWLFVFITGLASTVEADAEHRHHDRWEYAFVGTCACSDTSAFVAFDPTAVLSFLKEECGASNKNARPSRLVKFNIGTHKPPSGHPFVQALEPCQR
jgi:hypothetical protein